MLKNVVLPAPFGPIRLEICRSSTTKSTSWTAMRPPNSFLRLCASSSGMSARTGKAEACPAVSPVSGFRAHSGSHVVERLVVDALVELGSPAAARDQSLRPDEHD